MIRLPFKKLDVAMCDLHALRHISPKDLDREHELAKSCWWDYRGEHPTNRTLRFAAVYREKTQLFTEKYVDYTRRDFVSGLAGDLNIFPRVATDDDATITKKKRALTGLWRARQAADELQISYEIYIGACFEHAKMGGWQHLPRAIHLYSDRMKVVALDAQMKEIERYTPQFTNPLLMAGSQAPFKQEFDRWLYELGDLRTIHKEIAYKRMVDLGYITESQAAEWTVRALAS